MEVFLYEQATCGGEVLPPAVAVEGLGMFKTLLEGFERLGPVRTFVAPWIPYFPSYPRAENWKTAFQSCLEKADAALLVAPESGLALCSLTRELEAAGCGNLGSSSKALEITSDKYETYKRLGGLSPATEVFRGSTGLDYPLVAKPRSGVSGEGIYMVEDAAGLAGVPEGYLLQEYVAGAPCSASLLIGEEVLVLSYNTQELEGFSYMGAKLPLALECEEVIRAVERVKGLFGYVGVDFVHADGRARIIEINARPTTPIIALGEVLGCSAAELILGNYRSEGFPLLRATKKVHLRKSNGEGGYASLGGYCIELEEVHEDIDPRHWRGQYQEARPG